jgi:hypothetical protein
MGRRPRAGDHAVWDHAQPETASGRTLVVSRGAGCWVWPPAQGRAQVMGGPDGALPRAVIARRGLVLCGLVSRLHSAGHPLGLLG